MHFCRLCGPMMLSILACIHGPALALDPATLTGEITNSATGEPISGATVVISASRSLNWETLTDSDGRYEIEIPFSTGSSTRAVVVEAASPDHLPARLGGNQSISCYFGCPGDGEITIASGDLVTDQDLALSPGGGRFAGTVSATASEAPLADIEVIPYRVTEDGSVAPFLNQFAGVSAADGSYQLPLALPAGPYHVLAQSASQNVVTMTLGNVVCQFGQCAIAATDTLEITGNELLAEVNFTMRAGATLSGTLSPNDVTRVVRIFDGAGVMLDQIALPAGTSDWSRDRLAGGSYYIEMGPPAGPSDLIRRLHNGLTCPFFGCDRARGAPLEVPIGGSVSNIDVTLQTGGRLSGTIVDADSGLSPEASAEGSVGYFNLVTHDGTVAGGGLISALTSGVVFNSFGGIAPGEYFVRTFDSFYGRGIGDPRQAAGASQHLPGYVDAAFPDVACVGIACDLPQSGTVVITAGETTEIQIALERGSSIGGEVVDDASGEGIERAIVELVDAQNRRLATAQTGPDGEFFFGAFPEGSYFLRTAMSASHGRGMLAFRHAYFDRIWGADEPCSEQLCDPTSGNPLVLDGESDAGPLELRVVSGPVISGRIFDQSSGQMITRGQVEIRNANDALVGLYAIDLRDGRFQSTALPPDTYTLIPRVSPAFIPLPPPAASPDKAVAGLARADRQVAPGFQVALGAESVETELRVVDVGADRIFRTNFLGLPFGQ